MGRNTLEDQQIELFLDIKSIDKSSGVKNCLRCGEEKPLSSYGITHHRADGTSKERNICKECNKSQGDIVKKLRETIPPPGENHQCPICLRNKQDLESDYSTENAYQNVATAWVLDHDHDSGEFRGWLCNPCNSALGWFQDNINKVRRAVKYLENNC
tara:strand:+ start:10495 stop:10965 length:471 start_codon:yes stop_codon:yes gene_type:complete